jgi:hypothetical protein
VIEQDVHHTDDGSPLHQVILGNARHKTESSRELALAIVRIRHVDGECASDSAYRISVLRSDCGIGNQILEDLSRSSSA